MNATANTEIGKVPGWLRIVAALALLWNLIGIWSYLGSVGAVPSMGAADGSEMPAWATAAFAIAVFAGAIGSLGLLLLKRWASPLLILSLIAILAMDVWAFVLRPGGTPDVVMPIIVTGIGILLVWLASTASKRSWLR